MPIPTELVGSLPRPEKLQNAYAGPRRRQDHLGGAPGAAGRGRRGLHQAPRGDRRAGRHRRRAARVELRHLPDHRHARGDRPRREPRRRRPVLRDLRRRPPPPAAAPDRRPLPLQDLRLGVRREEPEDRDARRQAGRHRPVDADAALSARGRDRGLLARSVPRRPLRRGREGHPPVLRRRRRPRLDRLHRGAPGQQERRAQPLDRQGHAPGLHRPQQPVFDRFSAEERRNIGIHTCPGGDNDSVHSKEVPYEKLLSQDVRDQRGLLPHPVRQRGGQGGGLPALRQVQP